MSTYKSYSNKFNHECDFKVRYHFFKESEGGRSTLPIQGIRSDYRYEHEDHKDKEDWLFMIWPEFENLDGNLIESGQVFKEGVARMWVINPELREYHQKRIQLGQEGFFREGGKSTAICEVIEIVSLINNPTK